MNFFRNQVCTLAARRGHPHPSPFSLSPLLCLKGDGDGRKAQGRPKGGRRGRHAKPQQTTPEWYNPHRQATSQTAVQTDGGRCEHPTSRRHFPAHRVAASRLWCATAPAGPALARRRVLVATGNNITVCSPPLLLLPPPPLIPFSLPSSVLSTTFSTRSRCCPRYSSSSAANSSTLIRAWSLASGFSRRARSTSA
jgi:hypothetical protein